MTVGFNIAEASGELVDLETMRKMLVWLKDNCAVNIVDLRFCYWYNLDNVLEAARIIRDLDMKMLLSMNPTGERRTTPTVGNPEVESIVRPFYEGIAADPSLSERVIAISADYELGNTWGIDYTYEQMYDYCIWLKGLVKSILDKPVVFSIVTPELDTDLTHPWVQTRRAAVATSDIPSLDFFPYGIGIREFWGTLEYWERDWTRGRKYWLTEFNSGPPTGGGWSLLTEEMLREVTGRAELVMLFALHQYNSEWCAFNSDGTPRTDLLRLAPVIKELNAPTPPITPFILIGAGGLLLYWLSRG